MVGISLIGMGLMLGKMHPGFISDFDPYLMRLAGFKKKGIKGLSSKIFLVSKIFLKKAMSKNNLQSWS